MKIESLASIIESNIARVFKKFKEKPAVFLSKSDVMCYMYYLLVSDPFLGNSPAIVNLTPGIKKSKTFLVHAGLEVLIDGKSKQVALSIGESLKETDFSAWDFPVGIELEHNWKANPESEAKIKEELEKLANFKKGYLLCLNWESALPDESIQKFNELTAQHENVQFYYIDLCSRPIKTNVRKIA